MNQGYNWIPILYEGQIPFVDPIRRQTHPAANIQNCTDQIKKIFQFDMDQEDSWYTLTPGIVHQNAVFGPKDVSPVAVHSFPGLQDAGINTRSELSNFSDNILINAASQNALKKFSQKFIVFSNNNRNPDSYLIMLLEQTSMWTTISHLATSKSGLWIHWDQSHLFLNTAESILQCFYFLNLY